MSIEREALQTPALYDGANGARGDVIIFFGGKGGVGKTTLALNISVLLAQRGERVRIVAVPPVSASFSALASRAIAPAGRQLAAASLHNAETEWSRQLRELSQSATTVIVDAGTGLPTALPLLSQAATQLVLVTTPEPAALADAYAVLKQLEAAQLAAPLGVLVNMARTSREGSAACRRVRDAALRFLGHAPVESGGMPFDPRVMLANRRLVPFVTLYPNAPATRALACVAARLRGRQEVVPSRAGSIWPGLAGLFL